jgi:diaminohydroxyphosphoribosylaminopyrimidine deaminase/5-amino-6-(5-phosphoribosylamino)uracil reductase
VRVKLATSLDGQIALENGQSQWITGEAARADGHAWRARACAILTGSGTVRADNPQLNVRAVDTPRQPLKVVVDSHLSLDPDAKLFHDGQSIVATTQSVEPRNYTERWQARGVQLWQLPADAQGYVALPALLERLGSMGINELHVEAGSHLNSRLLQAGLIDELLWYMAPRLLGQGKPSFLLPSFTTLADTLGFQLIESVVIGGDLRLRLQPKHLADVQK